VRHARPPRTRWCGYHSRLSYILHTPVLLSATPAAAACFAKTRALRSLGDNLEMGGNHPHDADVNLPQVVRVLTLTPRLLWPGCSLSSEREITLFTRRINPLALRPRVPRRGDAHALAYMHLSQLELFRHPFLTTTPTPHPAAFSHDVTQTTF